MAAKPERSQYEKVGVVFVHGIGSQTRSSTLRMFADPLVDWLNRWHGDAARAAALAQKHVKITSFLSYGEQLPSDEPAHVAIALPRFEDDHYAWSNADWVLTEGWWAARLEAPDVVRMSLWSLRAYVRTLLRLITALLPEQVAEPIGDNMPKALDVRMPVSPSPEAKQRAEKAKAESDALRRARTGETPIEAVGGLIRRGLGPPLAALGWLWDELALLALFVIYLAVFPLGFIFVIVPLAFVAQIPGLARTSIFNVLTLFLTENVGDFYTYLFDEIQALHVREGVLKSVRWLDKEGCTRICVVGHSQGAVVAFDVVTQSDRESPGDVAKVTKLITLGEALNNAWALKPRELQRIKKELPAMRWVDFWSYFDPVPGTRPDVVIAGQPAASDRFGSIEVHNFMDVISEHGGYFANTEEFVARLAQEIDSPGERESSRFWFPKDEWDSRVERRRWRVRVLLTWRAIAMVAFGLALYGRWDHLADDGAALAGLLPLIPGLGDLAKLLGVLPAGLIAVLHRAIGFFSYAVLFELVYLVAIRPMWLLWDERVRNAAARLKVTFGWRWWLFYVPAVTVLTILVNAVAEGIALRSWPPALR